MARALPRFTEFGALVAMMAGIGGTSAANEPEARALGLKVIESNERVEIELIAHSPIAQQVEYEIMLTGTSRARHRGSTKIAAGERQVLSTLKAGIAGEWCANVDVREESGARYTLKAGNCSED